jgi:hypothetical protein
MGMVVILPDARKARLPATAGNGVTETAEFLSGVFLIPALRSCRAMLRRRPDHLIRCHFTDPLDVLVNSTLQLCENLAQFGFACGRGPRAQLANAVLEPAFLHIWRKNNNLHAANPVGAHLPGNTRCATLYLFFLVRKPCSLPSAASLDGLSL